MKRILENKCQSVFWFDWEKDVLFVYLCVVMILLGKNMLRRFFDDNVNCDCESFYIIEAVERACFFNGGV